MVVAPVPVILLIALFELGEISAFAMILFCIDTIRLIFLAVPCMVVIVLFVVIGASGPLILGAQPCRGHRNWGHQGGTQQSYVPETGHGYFPLRLLSTCRAKVLAHRASLPRPKKISFHGGSITSHAGHRLAAQLALPILIHLAPPILSPVLPSPDASSASPMSVSPATARRIAASREEPACVGYSQPPTAVRSAAASEL